MNNPLDHLTTAIQKSRTSGVNKPGPLQPQTTPVNIDSLMNTYGVNQASRANLTAFISAFQQNIQPLTLPSVNQMADAQGFHSKAKDQFITDLPGNIAGMVAHQLADRASGALGVAGPAAAFLGGALTGGVKAYVEYERKFKNKQAEFYQKKVAQKDRLNRETNNLTGLKKIGAKALGGLRTLNSGLTSLAVEKGFKVKDRRDEINNVLS